jgi:hypothetical protein
VHIGGNNSLKFSSSQLSDHVKISSLSRDSPIGNDAYAPELFVIDIILNKRKKSPTAGSREAVAVNFQTTCVAVFSKL